MGQQEKVRIVDISKVSPLLIDEKISPKSLPLTFFDIYWLKLAPVQRFFFFDFPSSNDNNKTFNSDVVSRLKHSLSLTLQNFVPLAGNLVWPESSSSPFVQYLEGQDGVSFTVAESDSADDRDYRILAGTDETFEARAYHPLVPNLAVSGEKAAVLAIQATLFPGRGFAIGITMHHAVMDGRSVHMFVKSWAHICKSGESWTLPDELRPFYDRTVLKDDSWLKEIGSRDWRNHNGPNNRSLMYQELDLPPDLVRRTFVLTRTNVEKFRRLVGTNEVVGDRVSTFSLAFAYVWVCLVRAEGIASDDSEAVMMIPCDCRSRLEPPLPATFFGNCVAGTAIIAEARDLAVDDWKDGLCSAVKCIVEGLKRMESDGVLNGAETWVSKMILFGDIASHGHFCSVAGSPRFEVYATDFGWGRPRKTDVVSNDRTRAISFQDARDGDGFEIGLALDKQVMEAFASLLIQGLSCCD